MNARLVVTFLVCATSLFAEPFEDPVFARAAGNVIRHRAAVETGANSRVEVVFGDGTMCRVGSNSVFRWFPGSREMALDKGTLLYSAPKGVGVKIWATGVVVTTSGTSLEMSNVGEDVKVISLDGKVRVGFVDQPAQRTLRPGDMVDVPPNATKVPGVVAINLKTLVDSSALMKMGDFPGRKAVEKNAAKQQPMHTFKVGALSPDGSSSAVGLAAAALTVEQIVEQRAQVAAQATLAATALSENTLTQQTQQAANVARLESARQQAAQQLAQQAVQRAVQQQVQVAQQQRAAQLRATGSSGQGNQGQGNMGQGNQGQGNGSGNVPPGQAKK